MAAISCTGITVILAAAAWVAGRRDRAEACRLAIRDAAIRRRREREHAREEAA